MIVDDDRTEAEPGLESPYVGLTYYTEATADRFFGRAHDASVIISNLRASRLTLLYAESGVGKSSVLRAGAAARLRARAEEGRAVRGRPRFVPVVFSSWSDRPVEGLIAAVEQAVAPLAGDGPPVELPRSSLEEALARGADAVGGTLLVILDQFEEYFLYRERERGVPFAEQFARCVNRADLRANFLIAIREDAYAGLGDLFRSSIPNVYGNFLHLDFLDLAGARDAITKPLERLNELHPEGEPFAVEDALVDAVLTQVRRRAEGVDGIDTTWLQLVLTRLFDEELAAGSHVLRATTLERLGGAQEIIETHLDRTMRALTDDEQRAAAAAFRYLVTQGGTKIALTVDDLAELSGVGASDLAPVLRRLAAHDLRILRPVARVEGGGTSYEISHDALARPIVEWRRRHDAADLAARLEAERVEKERAQQQAAEASARAARERRRKRIAIGLVVALVAACLAVAVALVVVQSRNADRQRRNAGRQRAIAAVQRRIDASIQSAERIGRFVHTADFGPTAAGLAGLEAERYAPTTQARDRVLALLQTDAGLATIGVGHRRDALAVTYLPSGIVASGSADETVRLWDGAGRELGQPLFTGTDAGQVYGLAAAHAGTVDLLAAARDDGGVDLWSLPGPSGARRVATVKASAETERAVAFDPAGTMLAAAGDDGQPRLYAVAASGLQRRGAGGAVGGINALAFSPDGRQLATAGDDGVRVWRVADFARGRTARPPAVLTAAASDSVAWARDGTVAAGSNGDQTGIRLFDVAGRARHAGFLTTTDVVDSLAFAADGSVLVSGGDDWSVTTWDVASGRPFGPPRTHDQTAVEAVAVSPDGRTIAAVDATGEVRQWPLDGRAALAQTVGALAPRELVAEQIGTDPPTIWDLALTGDGRVAVAADTAGVRIYEARPRGRETGPATTLPTTAGAYAIASAGDLLAFGNGAAVEVWDTGPACRGAHVPASSCRRADTSAQPFHTDNVMSLAFARSGGRLLLASGGNDGAIELWSVAAAGALRHLSSVTAGTRPAGVDDVAFSPGGQLMAAAVDDGSIRLFRTDDPAHPTPIGRPVVGHERQYVQTLAFSPDGRTLASGGGDQRVVLWQVDARRGIVRQLQSLFQTNSVLALTYSPDGRVLAAGDGDDSTCLYDARRAYSLIGGDTCLPGHASGANRTGIYALQFSPDGRTLYTAGEGSPVVAWSSPLWDESASARPALAVDVCQIAARNLTAGEWADAFAGTPLAGRRRDTCPPVVR